MRNLLEEWVPRVYRFALRLTLDPHAAEDLTQETMLRAWRCREQLHNPQAIRVWLLQITVNLWRDQLRRRLSRGTQTGALEEDIVDRAPSPERIVSGQENLRRALDAMDDLPPRQREVMYLSACEGLSASEIGEVLEMSANAVKANLSLARKKLRQQLQDLLPTSCSIE